MKLASAFLYLGDCYYKPKMIKLTTISTIPITNPAIARPLLLLFNPIALKTTAIAPSKIPSMNSPAKETTKPVIAAQFLESSPNPELVTASLFFFVKLVYKRLLLCLFLQKSMSFLNSRWLFIRNDHRFCRCC